MVGDKLAQLERAGISACGKRVSHVTRAAWGRPGPSTWEDRLSTASMHQFRRSMLTWLPMGYARTMTSSVQSARTAIDPDQLPDRNAPHTMQIDSYLAHRVPSGVLDMARQRGCEIFCGGNLDALLSTYRARGFSSCLRIESISTENYLLGNDKGDTVLVLSDFSSDTLVRHQLLQLHFAGVDLDKVSITGSIEQHMRHERQALDDTLAAMPHADRQVLFMGNRWKVMEHAARHLLGLPAQTHEADAYEAIAPVEHHVGTYRFDCADLTIRGERVRMIGLKMPNGSAAYEACDAFVRAGYGDMVLCGAGGLIGNSGKVGDYLAMTSSHFAGSNFTCSNARLDIIDGLPFASTASSRNITVDSPLVETRDWLDESRAAGVATVDVETAHIFRALADAPGPLNVVPGLFISDVVGGHESLDQPISADNAYRELGPFVARCLDAFGWPQASMSGG